MDQINPQPTTANGQPAMPAAESPETGSLRKNWRILVIVVISAILALVVFGLTVANRGRGGEKSNYFNKVRVGRTTLKEVKDIYGEPSRITSLGGADVYLYPAAKAPFMHQVVFSRERGKVLLVNEFVGSDSTLTLNDFIKRYRQYDRELFTTWGEDSRVYVFSKSGLLIHVDAPSGRVIEVGYFSPDQESEMMQIMGKYLLKEPPEHF